MIDRAFRSFATDPFLNLALEESLLERGFGGGSALLLYVNDPCVVIGRNQNPWAEMAAAADLPVLRRVSGGGAVYHDHGNLNWAFVLPRSRHDKDEELALVAGALRELGVRLEAGPRGGLFVSGEGPFKGAKVSGTARRLASERVLHHGTLLVDADLSRLRSCLGGLEVASSKALPSVPSPSVNLASLASGIGIEDVVRSLSRSICGSDMGDAAPFIDPSYADEASRRLRSWDWTWGATPAFSVDLPWSGGLACVELRGGRVSAVSGPGSTSLVELIGRPFDYGFPLACTRALEGNDIFGLFVSQT